VLPGPIVLVLEGQAKKGVPEGLTDGVEVVHAPGEGDDTLASLAAAADEGVLLVSADRGLAERARRSGAEVVGPNWLLDRLPG
jgi:rRNA-processing protein FCF1